VSGGAAGAGLWCLVYPGAGGVAASPLSAPAGRPAAPARPQPPSTAHLPFPLPLPHRLPPNRRHTPSDPRAFFRPDPSAPGGWGAAAKLALEDPTGQLDALLLGPATGQLLGVAPADPRAHPGAADDLAAALARLGDMPPSGAGPRGEGAAWLEVAVTAVFSAAAAAAVEAAAAAVDAGADNGTGEGAAAVATGAALAAPGACVYLIHDTHLAGAPAF
jgi:hypothetical protein